MNRRQALKKPALRAKGLAVAGLLMGLHWAAVAVLSHLRGFTQK